MRCVAKLLVYLVFVLALCSVIIGFVFLLRKFLSSEVCLEEEFKEIDRLVEVATTTPPGERITTLYKPDACLKNVSKEEGKVCLCVKERCRCRNLGDVRVTIVSGESKIIPGTEYKVVIEKNAIQFIPLE